VIEALKEDKIRKRLLKKGWRQIIFLWKKNKNIIQMNKEKYGNTPINKRISDAVSKGSKANANIRNEKIAQEHRYDYWWLGGKKIMRKTTRRKTTRKKSRKNRQ
jgi:hypothetical protein